MKKIGSIGGVVASILLFSGASVFGATLEVVPSLPIVPLGDPLTVDVNISELGNFASPSLGAFDLALCFDPTLLSFVDITFGPFLGDEAAGEAITGFSIVGDDLMAFEVSLLLPADLIALQPDAFTLFTVTFDTIGTGTSPLDLLVNALSDELGDPLPATVVNSSVVVGGGVDLMVSKTESVDPVIPGSGAGNLTYVVTVTNAGTSDATGVELSEALTLPAGVTIDSITPSGATSFADPTWTVGNLPSGISETLTVILTVDASAAIGIDTISDTATVTAVNEPVINPEDDSVTESTSVGVSIIGIPTLSEWGLLLLMLALVGAGLYRLRL